MARVDDAVESLRDDILAGRFVTGDKLVAEDLAQEYGMSRTPIREAFHVLASEGLIELAKGRGARVSMWTDEELESVFETRIRLEGLAASRAADRITVAQADHLDALAAKIAEFALPGPQRNLELRQLVNKQFHSTIMAISDSPTIETALTRVLHASVLGRTQSGYDEDAERRIVAHHFDIVAALRAGDGAWAESTMRSHLLAARASLLGPRRKLSEGAGTNDDLRERHVK